VGIAGDMLNRKAAALYPTCKLRWLQEGSDKEEVTLALFADLRASMRAHQQPASNADDASQAGSLGSRCCFLDSMMFGEWGGGGGRRGGSQAADDAAMQEATGALHAYLSSAPVHTDVSSVQFPHPAVRKLFIKYNTAMPSSAASERLFSVGRRILHYLRTRMHDSTFEASMLVHINGGKEYI
jgi:hypothetical protein